MPRYKIILNLGRALQYLHEDCSFCVLHCDIKSSNILLDSRYVAKLGDFGLARFIDHDIELTTTCNIAGTLGYVDPDFVTTGKRSRESDIYSFGIVLLEMVSGRRPAVVDHQTMVTPLLLWVWGKKNGGAILEAVDPALREESTAGDWGQMERALLVGLWCAHPEPTQRPSIADATRALQSRDMEIPHLPLPAFMAGPSNFSVDDTSRASETSDGRVSSSASRGELQWTH
jgi:interleukin-1 receptor-associated kinase 1